MNGKPLVYLDNGATTQKPRAVIEAVAAFYGSQNANIHRGVYQLSQTATRVYEEAREKVRGFIHAADAGEIIFTRGTTESSNLVAASWGRANLTAGDVVVVSHLEHHSNIVPWQMACALAGAELKVIPINERGELELGVLDRFLADGRVRMVAVNHVSNSLGTINPVERIVEKAHAAGALVLIDGAQWVAHGLTDVQKLDVDFYAFSGHKMYGPTGIGVLYGIRKLLEAMPPYQGGGDMIESVRFEKTTYAALPNKFEAGTPNSAGAVGLGAAVDFLRGLDWAETSAQEKDLLAYATGRVAEVPGLRMLGTAREKASVLSFVMDGGPLGGRGDFYAGRGRAVGSGGDMCKDRASLLSAGDGAHGRGGDGAGVVCVLQYARGGGSAGGGVAEDIGGGGGGAERKVPPHRGAMGIRRLRIRGRRRRAWRRRRRQLAEEFAFMGDVGGEGGGREAKSQFVLDTAKSLPHHFDLLKQVTQRIPGCMSQVYLVGREKPGEAGTFEFVADADAEIVRGLIAILEQLYSGQKAREVAAFDIEAFFRKIGLEQFITSQRRNGLSGMVAKIRTLAKGVAT